MNLTPITTALLNWKTTAPGVTAIVTGIVHIGYCIHRGSLSESDLVVTILAILGGFALIAAADAGQSAAAHADSLAKIDDLARKTAEAIETKDTSHLVRPDITNIDPGKPNLTRP